MLGSCVIATKEPTVFQLKISNNFLGQPVWRFAWEFFNTAIKNELNYFLKT
jgi:hypothetical protein